MGGGFWEIVGEETWKPAGARHRSCLRFLVLIGHGDV